MVSIASFTQIAGSFPGITVQPHFEKTAFRIGKKNFATLDIPNQQARIKLSLIDQDIFIAFDHSIIFPAPGKWGKHGWTFINLKKVPEPMFKDALKTAYRTVAPAKLSAQLKESESIKKKNAKHENL